MVKTSEGGLVVKTTEVGEDIWDLDISKWGDVAIMGVEDELMGGEFGNNYDVTGTPGNEYILNLGVVLKSCTLWRSIVSIIIIVSYC